MKKNVKRLLWLIAAALTVWFGLTLNRREPVPEYLTDTVRRTTIRQTVAATGEITAAQLVDVGAQASGQIKAMHVAIGQEVRKGDLIAEIDDAHQRNRLNTQKAVLDTYRAQLAAAQTALRHTARRLARENALLAENATSPQEQENAENAHTAAQARVTELQSLIRQTKIAIDTAQSDLGHTRIISPIDGTVVALVVQEGQTVSANQSIPTIVQVANLRQMLNKMQIAEGDRSKVAAGQTLHFTTLSEPERTRQTVLDSVDPGLTAMSQGRYTNLGDNGGSAVYYYARATVANEDGKLAIGMTTQNEITVGQAENVLAVPAMAVRSRDGRRHVRILHDDGSSAEHTVETGISDGTLTEIRSGLEEGQTVIVSESNGQTPAGGGRRPARM